MNKLSAVYILSSLLFLLIAGCNNSGNNSDNKTKEASQRQARQSFSDSIRIYTENVYVYNCEKDVRFSAYVTPDSAWVFLPDTTGVLSSSRSASGTKFESNGFRYWSQGSEAMLEVNGHSYTDCAALPQEKSWEAAKLRGVHFRALGQEPGWILEIKEGGQLTYSGQYGTDTLTVPTPDPQKQNQKLTYSVQSDSARSIEVEITEETCTGAMNGFQHPFSVRLSVDKKTYRGCGRFLQ